MVLNFYWLLERFCFCHRGELLLTGLGLARA
jgi:hypothetical protein